MVRIRPFEEGDTARLLAIEKVCPHGNEQCAVGVDKKSSITARYALYDNWNVLVAEEDDEDEAGAGEVGGWIGWTAKQSPTQQERHHKPHLATHRHFLTEQVLEPFLTMEFFEVYLRN